MRKTQYRVCREEATTGGAATVAATGAVGASTRATAGVAGAITSEREASVPLTTVARGTGSEEEISQHASASD